MIKGKLKVALFIIALALNATLALLTAHVLDEYWPWELGHPLTTILLYIVGILGFIILLAGSFVIVFGPVQVFLDRNKPVLNDDDWRRILDEGRKRLSNAEDVFEVACARSWEKQELLKYKKRNPFDIEHILD